MRNTHKILVKEAEGKRLLLKRKTTGMIILKWAFYKWGLSEFNWRRIKSSSGIL
jgi:hypothetical protein